MAQQSDIEALILGLKDGTIDMVTTDHNPIDIEHKKIEFDYAKNGTIGLESAFGVLNTLFTTKKAVQLLSKGKERFGVQNHTIQLGEKACLSLFTPDGSSNFGEENIYSTAKNCIFIGQTTQGKVYGSIHGNKYMV